MLHHSILIIDDTQALASSLASRLAREGYQAHGVASVREAFQFLKTHEAPTFILADRMLAEPIELRDLERLREAATESKILVYTSVEDLTDEEQQAILTKGAYRVIAKSAVEEIVKNITRLTQELDELLELAAELEKMTRERHKIMAALVGSDVAITVIDRHGHRWYKNPFRDRLGGGACKENCWMVSFGRQGEVENCWGCPLSGVFTTQSPIEGLILDWSPGGSVRWIAVRATPIFNSAGKAIIAVREAVTPVGDASLNSLSLEQRLFHIAQGLVRCGFGRARIYRAISDSVLHLVAGAARSDDPYLGKSEYFETIRQLPLDLTLCPYALHARAGKMGQLVERWRDEAGISNFSEVLQLETPYFDVPLWGKNGDLEAWIAVDFAMTDFRWESRAIARLARNETLIWLRDEFGRAISQAFEASGASPGNRSKFDITQRARLGIAGAKSVDDATREIREAFEQLLPKCAVSVCMTAGNELRRFESLCLGPRRPTAPDVISIQDPHAFSASVVRSQIPVWISDYGLYRRAGAERGDPPGYANDDLRSTAHIPLRFESIVFGSLSIDAYDYIRWDEDGYKEPLLSLANDTALVLRDLALHESLEQAMADRAAITAYFAGMSADALWRHWSQQRLAEASAIIGTIRLVLSQDDPLRLTEAERLLSQLSTAVARIHSARPERAEDPTCSAEVVFSQLESVYSYRRPRPDFRGAEQVPLLRISAFVLRNILIVLLDNALRAIQESSCGSMVTVDAQLEANHVCVRVTDDGPGVPANEQTRILRERLESRRGQGLGLLFARGAALEHGGDLTFSPQRKGAVFSLTLPVDR